MTWSSQYKELFATHGRPSNSFSVWTEKDLELVDEREAHSEQVSAGAFSPDGLIYCTVASDDKVKFWDPFPDLNAVEHQAYFFPQPRPPSLDDYAIRDIR